MQVEETHATGGLAATLAQEVARVAQLANEYYGIMGRACVQLERNLYYRQLVNTPPEYRISDEGLPSGGVWGVRHSPRCPLGQNSDII